MLTQWTLMWYVYFSRILLLSLCNYFLYHWVFQSLAVSSVNVVFFFLSFFSFWGRLAVVTCRPPSIVLYVLFCTALLETMYRYVVLLSKCFRRIKLRIKIFINWQPTKIVSCRQCFGLFEHFFRLSLVCFYFFVCCHLTNEFAWYFPTFNIFYSSRATFLT